MSSKVEVNLPHHSYEVVIGSGLLDGLGELIRAVAPHDRCTVVGDAAVMEVYGQRAIGALESAGYEAATAVMPSGEKHKTLETVRAIYDVLLERRMERRSPVIALGGGVCGDTAGFVAASYLRGVPFVQVPTTLLAMVDASVGGKVGVNVPQGKNLIGAFHQPAIVLADVMVLQTLSPREFRCGLAECIKHGVIRDPSLLDFISEQMPKIQAMNPGVLEELVRRNVAIKAAVVMADEKESGERAHLNFGHTFAHAIEAVTEYGTFLHGEAVSLGMVAAMNLAVGLGICDSQAINPLVAALESAGLPVRAKLPDVADLMAAMTLDKKVKDAKIRFVLPTRIGEVVIRNDVPNDRVEAAWATVMD